MILRVLKRCAEKNDLKMQHNAKLDDAEWMQSRQIIN